MCVPSQLLTSLMPTENMNPPAGQVHDVFVTGKLLPQTEHRLAAMVFQWQEGFRVSETKDEGINVLNMVHTCWQNTASCPDIVLCAGRSEQKLGVQGGR